MNQTLNGDYSFLSLKEKNNRTRSQRKMPIALVMTYEK
jgi:hypothetical protein